MHDTYVAALLKFYGDPIALRLCFSGVKLEFKLSEISNNTLLTMDNIGEETGALFCSTDRKACCVNESDIHENWFLPNGSKVLATNNTHFGAAYVTWGIQTVGLNRVNNDNSLNLPSGVYHCEMVDRNNVTHYLYVGIYHENEGKAVHTNRVYITL